MRRYVDAAAAARPETPRAALVVRIRDALARGAADGDALFDLRARTRDTLANLRAREATCDVRCADFVAARDASDDDALFLTQNHPASPLLRFCADAALATLGLPPLSPDEAACDDANAARIPGRVWPPVSRKPLQLRFNMTLYESMRAIFVSKSRVLVQR